MSLGAGFGGGATTVGRRAAGASRARAQGYCTGMVRGAASWPVVEMPETVESERRWQREREETGMRERESEWPV